MTTPTQKNQEYGLLWWLIRDKSEVVGYYVQGWLDQHLVIYPDMKVVAVRMRRGLQEPSDSENNAYGLMSFPRMIRDLVKGTQ